MAENEKVLSASDAALSEWSASLVKNKPLPTTEEVSAAASVMGRMSSVRKRETSAANIIAANEKRWSDPAEREKHRETMKAVSAERWSDPQQRENHRAAMRAAWERRKAKNGQDSV